jgi:hypothetical protein
MGKEEEGEEVEGEAWGREVEVSSKVWGEEE